MPFSFPQNSSGFLVEKPDRLLRDLWLSGPLFQSFLLWLTASLYISCLPEGISLMSLNWGPSGDPEPSFHKKAHIGMGGRLKCILAHLPASAHFPGSMFLSKVGTPTVTKQRITTRGQVLGGYSSTGHPSIFSSFLPSPRQTTSKARETPSRHPPWTPLETLALCPPGKRLRQRSRRLSTKVPPAPLSPGSEASHWRGAQRRARSHPRKRGAKPP